MGEVDGQVFTKWCLDVCPPFLHRDFVLPTSTPSPPSETKTLLVRIMLLLSFQLSTDTEDNKYMHKLHVTCSKENTITPYVFYDRWLFQ